MLSFASVAVTADGEHVGEFEAVLEPLPGARPDPTCGRGSTPSHRRCSRRRRPTRTDRLFHGPGLCLKSLACGVTGGDWATFSVHDLPSEWFGDVPYTHRAIDDARGYANLLVEVLRRSRR